MEVKLLDISRQYEALKDEIEPAVIRQMRSGMYIMGPAVTGFEKKFAEYVHVKYAVAVNSGTDALIIALKALGIGPRDEVITTPFTFFATAETIAMVGAVPIFVDIDPVTYNIDPAKIEEKITSKTKALMPVHVFGQSADMNAIRDIAKRHSLKIIEDVCQAIGATYDGESLGSCGDLGCFSFYPTKNLGGFGDGGMITTNDEKVAVICRALREHGMAQNGAKARFLLEGIKDELEGTASPDGLYNPYKYYNYLVGYNSRLDALQAVVLSVKLDHLAEFNKKRLEIAEYYSEALAGLSAIVTPKGSTGHVWHQYAVCCEDKDALGQYLSSRGVGTAAFYPVPLHLQKAFTHLGYEEGSLPNAEKLCRSTVCLPIFPELRREELEYVVECIKDFDTIIGGDVHGDTHTSNGGGFTRHQDWRRDKDMESSAGA